MRIPFVSLRRYEDAVAGQERLREERDQARKDHKSAQEAAKTAASLFTRADKALAAISKTNACLTEELASARAELAETREELADSTAAGWRRKYREEKARADQLQKQYDDAVGLTGARPQDSSRWQPGYVDPKADAS